MELGLPEVYSPWQVFDKSWKLAMGHPTNDFHLTTGGTFMTTFEEVVAVTTSYYLAILLGHKFMRNRPAFRLNDIFQLHNLALATISGVLLLLFLEQLLPTIWIHGLHHSICESGGWTDQLAMLYYVCQ